jgi:hypothetical protein
MQVARFLARDVGEAGDRHGRSDKYAYAQVDPERELKRIV